MKLYYQLTLSIKINSRWIKELNMSRYTIKVLEENIGRKISYISSSNIFTDMSPRASNIKERINKGDLIKKASAWLKKTALRSKANQPYGKIFADDISDKSLISKIYKALA